MTEILSKELVKLARCGESTAISELVVKFRKPFYIYACHYLGNEFEAEDATQEALLKIIKGLPGFKGLSSLETWMFRILTNVCIDQKRRQKNQPLIHSCSQTEEGISFEIPDQRPLPEEEVESSELRQSVREALNKLSVEHREVILLHDLYSFKYQEIVKITGVSLGTIKSRLFYARQELKKYLEI